MEEVKKERKKPDRTKYGLPNADQITFRPNDRFAATPDTIRKIGLVANKIQAGEKRSDIQNWIMENFEVGDRQARQYYGAAMRLLIPTEEEFGDYKLAMVQVNLGRIEKIIDNTIDGDSSDKKVALDAIKEINKIIGAYQDKTTVMVNKNNDGDEQFIIQIDNG